MSSLIRRLEENELRDLARLSICAFSANGSLQEAENGYLELLETLHNNAPEQHMHGVFRDNQLVGGMRMIDYKMNIRNNFVDIGGAAGVATDLIHKREGVARELITYFIRHYRNNGAVMTVLYPFRADFYRKMGFGLGTEIREYRIKPCEFPKAGDKSKLVYMDASQCNLIVDCYQRFAEQRNGMTIKTGLDYFWLFHEGSNQIVAYREGGEVKGYISFKFIREGINTNHMIINEFIYESREVLMGLCSFLHDQSDQIDRVIIKSQDENIHYLFGDPSNGSYLMMHDAAECVIADVAVGMMYRVINTRRMFELLDGKCFGVDDLKLKLSVRDDLIDENNESLILHFAGGKVNVSQEEDYAAEVCLDVDNFSSMLMGCVSFTRLYSLGLARIDQEQYIDRISRIFVLDSKPMCVSAF